jgi:hypothetical protein
MCGFRAHILDVCTPRENVGMKEILSHAENEIHIRDWNSDSPSKLIGTGVAQNADPRRT